MSLGSIFIEPELVEFNFKEGMNMFVDNAVVKKFEGEERYDRFSIASTLFDVSFKGAE
jgi:hypothetical protein